MKPKTLLIRASGNAKVFFGRDEAEHDECVRLREENRHLKQMLAERDETIKESRKLVNHFLGTN